MTVEQLIDKYKLFLQNEYGIEQGRDQGDKAISPREHAEHLFWMLEQMRKEEVWDDPLKLNRWLGFVQGAFWRGGEMRIKDMRDQTRGLTL